MGAYIIASYDVTDPDGYMDYVPGVLPLLQKHGGEILVADYGARALEGDERGVIVVLRFASDEAARAWHDDPAYQPFKKVRLDSCANNSLILAKQFVPPS